MFHLYSICIQPKAMFAYKYAPFILNPAVLMYKLIKYLQFKFTGKKPQSNQFLKQSW